MSFTFPGHRPRSNRTTYLSLPTTPTSHPPFPLSQHFTPVVPPSSSLVFPRTFGVMFPLENRIHSTFRKHPRNVLSLYWTKRRSILGTYLSPNISRSHLRPLSTLCLSATPDRTLPPPRLHKNFLRGCLERLPNRHPLVFCSSGCLSRVEKPNSFTIRPPPGLALPPRVFVNPQDQCLRKDVVRFGRLK